MNNSDNDIVWHSKYAALKSHLDNSGGVYPSWFSKDSKIAKLGFFSMIQRQYYKNGKLSDEKVQVLEKLDGWVWELPKRHPPKKCCGCCGKQCKNLK